MTETQINDTLVRVNVSLLRLNDTLAKLEAARLTASNGKIALNDNDYVLDDEAGWFDVGPFTVRLYVQDEGLNIRVYDREKATEFNLAELEHFTIAASECE